MRGSLLTFVVLGACLGPTEVFLEITTNDCASLSQVSIYVGPADAAPIAPAATASGCSDAGVIGTLAVVPSGSDTDEIAITIEGAPAGVSACGPDAGCILARRAVEYIPHQALTLPVFLDVSCAGVECDPGSTCIASDAGIPSCVDAHGKCTGGSCTVAPGSCAAPGVVLTGNTAKYTWSFDVSAAEDHGLVPNMLAAQNSLDFASPEVPGCGGYLHAATAQQLATSVPVSGMYVAVALYFRVEQGSASIVDLASWLSATVASGQVTATVAGKPYPLGQVDSSWHALVLNFNGVASRANAWLDGTAIGPLPSMTDAGAPSHGALTVGGNGPVDVDQIAIYE